MTREEIISLIKEELPELVAEIIAEEMGKITIESSGPKNQHGSSYQMIEISLRYKGSIIGQVEFQHGEERRPW